MDIRADDKKYIANTYNRFDVVISGGHGAEIIDNDGKKYIDMGSGIAVNIFGIGDENWTDAVKGQLDKFAHTSNLYYSAPPVALAKMLCEKTGMKKVFFANSGAEVNECAIKLARRHGEKNLDGAFKIICLKQSFHGRTLATLSATGQDVFHQSFLPLVDGFLFCEPNNITEFKSLVGNNKCCAVLFEMIQGEGGINVLDTDFVKECFAICKEKNLLFMADEVQTGNGRTGELYAFMNFGILPDVFTTAKGLGGGLPIGACVMGKKAENLFLPGDNGSTFGANPAICAGACSVLERLTPEFLAEVKRKGEYLKDELKKVSGVLDVCGMGLMLGVLTEKSAKDVANELIKKGVLALTAKNKLRLLPPLTITYSEIDEFIRALKEVV